jgi:hypothetical protein
MLLFFWVKNQHLNLQINNSMIISEHVEDKPNKHWEELCQPLHLYKYTDVYSDKFYKTLKDTVISHLTNYNKLTYLTHRTSFSLEGKRLHIASHAQNDRLQKVVYDLTFVKEYWDQTNDTIYDWAWDYLQNNIHPVFFQHINTFRNLKPHTDDMDSWIPFRWHINYLDYSRYLHLHADMNHQYFNTPLCHEARARSLTFYLHDHVEGHGGELYFLNGHIHKPIQNEGVLINGNAVLHGINSNMNPDKTPRLAFTTRWAHKDDLYLPGSVNKAMYTIDFPETS